MTDSFTPCTSNIFKTLDTLQIEFKPAEVAESKDLDENSKDLDENPVLDLDQSGKICGNTIEHASQRTDIQFFYELVAA